MLAVLCFAALVVGLRLQRIAVLIKQGFAVTFVPAGMFLQLFALSNWRNILVVCLALPRRVVLDRRVQQELEAMKTQLVKKSIGVSLLELGAESALQALREAELLGARVERRASGVTVVDCTNASAALGVLLVNVCCAGRVNVELIQRSLFGQPWPHIRVTSLSGMSPTLAFLCSQFAGRQFFHEQGAKKRYWMGSGPFRAWTEEPLWEHLGIEVESQRASESQR